MIAVKDKVDLRSNTEWNSIGQAEPIIQTGTAMLRGIQVPKDQKRCSARVGQYLSVVASTLTSYTSSRRLSKGFLCRVVDLFLLST